MKSLDKQIDVVKNLREKLKLEEAKLQVLLKECNSEKLGRAFTTQTPIEILHLPQRAYSALISVGILSIETLQVTPISDLRRIKNLGNKGVSIIIDTCRKKEIELVLTK